MDVSTNFIRLFLISLLFILSRADECVKRSSCSCVFPNGTGIDLSPSAKNSVYTAVNTYTESADDTQLSLFTYFYHPCNDVLLKTNATADMTNTCNKPLALCRQKTQFNKISEKNDLFNKTESSYEFLGSSNNSAELEFAADGSFIKYSNVPSFTTVYLVCAETDDQFFVKDMTEDKNVQLAFFSRNACLRQIESTRSVGSTLLIVFFSFVIFYLVLGVCTKKFLMGATGIEVIPNLMFWTELPNLVKDGWAFARSGFKLPTRGPGPSTSPDPNSYDSI